MELRLCIQGSVSCIFTASSCLDSRTLRRFLLMEGRVSHAVGTAVKALGVALHHYDFEDDGEEPNITFLPDFLTLCGVS